MNIKKLKSLTPDVIHIIKDKGTELPFSSKENELKDEGSYLCRGCGSALFRSECKFNSGCGWPSFDDEIAGAITRKLDGDGRRTEILCSYCHAHLGHVFVGEYFTPKNLRHCVYSLSIEFIENTDVMKTEEVILGGGCFWGVEFLMRKLPGVLSTEVGYIGGKTDKPTYEQVCSHTTGYIEAVKIIFDPEKISYEKIIKYFCEIHNPEQSDGQGPDIGSQYISCIFYFDDCQKKSAENIIDQLKNKGFKVSTQLKPVSVFWKAEDYHQQYYEKNKKAPYCHFYTKRF